MCPAFLQFRCNVIHCKSVLETDLTIICVPCMLEHVWTLFKQINENLRPNVCTRMFWEPV